MRLSLRVAHNLKMFQAAVEMARSLLHRDRESTSDESKASDEPDRSFSRQVRQRVDSTTLVDFDIDKPLTSNGVGKPGFKVTHENYSH